MLWPCSASIFPTFSLCVVDLLFRSPPETLCILGPQKNEGSWDLMRAFGRRDTTVGRCLVTPHPLSVTQRSASTQNMWEWENVILYLTSRCLSGLPVYVCMYVSPSRLTESSAAGCW